MKLDIKKDYEFINKTLNKDIKDVKDEELIKTILLFAAINFRLSIEPHLLNKLSSGGEIYDLRQTKLNNYIDNAKIKTQDKVVIFTFMLNDMKDAFIQARDKERNALNLIFFITNELNHNLDKQINNSIKENQLLLKKINNNKYLETPDLENVIINALICIYDLLYCITLYNELNKTICQEYKLNYLLPYFYIDTASLKARLDEIHKLNNIHKNIFNFNNEKLEEYTKTINLLKLGTITKDIKKIMELTREDIKNIKSPIKTLIDNNIIGKFYAENKDFLNVNNENLIYYQTLLILGFYD